MLRLIPFESCHTYHFAKRLVATLVCAIYTATNCVLAHAYESNVWKERQRGVLQQIARLPISSSIPPVIIPRHASWRGMQSATIFQKKAENWIPAFAGMTAFGSIRKISNPKIQNSKSKTIIHIQDVHMNAEAQANIGKAVQELVAGNNVDMIALEGAFSPIDLSRFRAFPRQDVIKMVSDYLLERNRISGPVHALLTENSVPSSFRERVAEGRVRANAGIAPESLPLTPSLKGGGTPTIVGIDDRAHYTANVQAYKDAAKLVPSAKKKLEKARRVLAEKKITTFNSELIAFDHAVEAHRNGKSTMGQYVRALQRFAADVPIACETFLEALDMEERLNFTRVEAERARLLEKLLAALNENETGEMVNAGNAYRAGSVRHADFYSYLTSLCEKKGVPLKQFPAMRDYLQYVLLSDSIDPEKLLAGVREMEERIYASLAPTPEERALITESRRLHLTEKLLNFALTREEWTEYKTLRPADLSNSELKRPIVYQGSNMLKESQPKIAANRPHMWDIETNRGQIVDSYVPHRHTFQKNQRRLNDSPASDDQPRPVFDQPISHADRGAFRNNRVEGSRIQNHVQLGAADRTFESNITEKNGFGFSGESQRVHRKNPQPRGMEGIGPVNIKYTSSSDPLRCNILASNDWRSRSWNRTLPVFLSRLVQRNAIHWFRNFLLASDRRIDNDSSLSVDRGGELPTDNNIWQLARSTLEPFEAFYEHAEIRDEKMAGNLLKAVPRTSYLVTRDGQNKGFVRGTRYQVRGTSLVVLVTGGFHSAGIDQRLVDAGYTVVSFTPKITKVETENGSAYLSVFTQEKTPLEKLFEGEKLFLATDPAAGVVRDLPFAACAITGQPADLGRLDPNLTEAYRVEPAAIPKHSSRIKVTSRKTGVGIYIEAIVSLKKITAVTYDILETSLISAVVTAAAETGFWLFVTKLTWTQAGLLFLMVFVTVQYLKTKGIPPLPFEILCAQTPHGILFPVGIQWREYSDRVLRTGNPAGNPASNPSPMKDGLLPLPDNSDWSGYSLYLEEQCETEITEIYRSKNEPLATGIEHLRKILADIASHSDDDQGTQHVNMLIDLKITLSKKVKLYHIRIGRSYRLYFSLDRAKKHIVFLRFVSKDQTMKKQKGFKDKFMEELEIQFENKKFNKNAKSLEEIAKLILTPSSQITAPSVPSIPTAGSASMKTENHYFLDQLKPLGDLLQLINMLSIRLGLNKNLLSPSNWNEREQSKLQRIILYILTIDLNSPHPNFERIGKVAGLIAPLCQNLMNELRLAFVEWRTRNYKLSRQTAGDFYTSFYRAARAAGAQHDQIFPYSAIHIQTIKPAPKSVPDAASPLEKEKPEKKPGSTIQPVESIPTTPKAPLPPALPFPIPSDRLELSTPIDPHLSSSEPLFNDLDQITIAEKLFTKLKAELGENSETLKFLNAITTDDISLLLKFISHYFVMSKVFELEHKYSLRSSLRRYPQISELIGTYLGEIISSTFGIRQTTQNNRQVMTILKKQLFDNEGKSSQLLQQVFPIISRNESIQIDFIRHEALELANRLDAQRTTFSNLDKLTFSTDRDVTGRESPYVLIEPEWVILCGMGHIFYSKRPIVVVESRKIMRLFLRQVASTINWSHNVTILSHEEANLYFQPDQIGVVSISIERMEQRRMTHEWIGALAPLIREKGKIIFYHPLKLQPSKKGSYYELRKLTPPHIIKGLSTIELGLNKTPYSWAQMAGRTDPAGRFFKDQSGNVEAPLTLFVFTKAAEASQGKDAPSTGSERGALRPESDNGGSQADADLHTSGLWMKWFDKSAEEAVRRIGWKWEGFGTIGFFVITLAALPWFQLNIFTPVYLVWVSVPLWAVVAFLGLQPFAIIHVLSRIRINETGQYETRGAVPSLNDSRAPPWESVRFYFYYLASGALYYLPFMLALTHPEFFGAPWIYFIALFLSGVVWAFGAHYVYVEFWSGGKGLNIGFSKEDEQYWTRYPSELTEALARQQPTSDPLVIADISMSVSHIAAWTAKPNSRFRVISLVPAASLIPPSRKFAEEKKCEVVEVNDLKTAPQDLRNLESPAVAFAEADVSEGLPFPDGSLDAIVIHRARDNLITPEIRKAFADELDRVLKPGGYVSIVEDMLIEPGDPENAWYQKRYAVTEKILPELLRRGLASEVVKPVFLEIMKKPGVRLLLSMRDRKGKKINDELYLGQEEALLQAIDKAKVLIIGVGVHQPIDDVIRSFPTFDVDAKWLVEMPEDMTGKRSGHFVILKGLLLRKNSDSSTSDSTTDSTNVFRHKCMSRVQDLAGFRTSFPWAPIPRVAAMLVNEKGQIVSEATNEHGIRHAERLAILNAFEKIITERQMSEGKSQKLGDLENAASYLRLLLLTSSHFSQAALEVYRWLNEQLDSPLSNLTLFVNMEPCDNCAQTLCAVRPGTVVFGTVDQNHDVNGKGRNLLEEHGIRVFEGVLNTSAYAHNRHSFFLLKRLRRVYVFVRDVHKALLSWIYWIRYGRLQARIKAALPSDLREKVTDERKRPERLGRVNLKKQNRPGTIATIILSLSLVVSPLLDRSGWLALPSPAAIGRVLSRKKLPSQKRRREPRPPLSTAPPDAFVLELESLPMIEVDKGIFGKQHVVAPAVRGLICEQLKAGRWVFIGSRAPFDQWTGTGRNIGLKSQFFDELIADLSRNPTENHDEWLSRLVACANGGGSLYGLSQNTSPVSEREPRYLVCTFITLDRKFPAPYDFYNELKKIVTRIGPIPINDLSYSLYQYTLRFKNSVKDDEFDEAFRSLVDQLKSIAGTSDIHARISGSRRITLTSVSFSHALKYFYAMARAAESPLRKVVVVDRGTFGNRASDELPITNGSHQIYHHQVGRKARDSRPALATNQSSPSSPGDSRRSRRRSKILTYLNQSTVQSYSEAAAIVIGSVCDAMGARQELGNWEEMGPKDVWRKETSRLRPTTLEMMRKSYGTAPPNVILTELNRGLKEPGQRITNEVAEAILDFLAIDPARNRLGVFTELQAGDSPRTGDIYLQFLNPLFELAQKNSRTHLLSQMCVYAEGGAQRITYNPVADRFNPESNENSIPSSTLDSVSGKAIDWLKQRKIYWESQNVSQYRVVIRLNPKKEASLSTLDIETSLEAILNAGIKNPVSDPWLVNSNGPNTFVISRKDKQWAARDFLLSLENEGLNAQDIQPLILTSFAGSQKRRIRGAVQKGLEISLREEADQPLLQEAHAPPYHHESLTPEGDVEMILRAHLDPDVIESVQTHPGSDEPAVATAPFEPAPTSHGPRKILEGSDGAFAGDSRVQPILDSPPKVLALVAAGGGGDIKTVVKEALTLKRMYLQRQKLEKEKGNDYRVPKFVLVDTTIKHKLENPYGGPVPISHLFYRDEEGREQPLERFCIPENGGQPAEHIFKIKPNMWVRTELPDENKNGISEALMECPWSLGKAIPGIQALDDEFEVVVMDSELSALELARDLKKAVGCTSDGDLGVIAYDAGGDVTATYPYPQRPLQPGQEFIFEHPEKDVRTGVTDLQTHLFILWFLANGIPQGYMTLTALGADGEMGPNLFPQLAELVRAGAWCGELDEAGYFKEMTKRDGREAVAKFLDQVLELAISSESSAVAINLIKQQVADPSRPSYFDNLRDPETGEWKSPDAVLRLIFPDKKMPNLPLRQGSREGIFSRLATSILFVDPEIMFQLLGFNVPKERLFKMSWNELAALLESYGYTNERDLKDHFARSARVTYEKLLSAFRGQPHGLDPDTKLDWRITLQGSLADTSPDNLLNLLQNDSRPLVRIAAAAALGPAHWELSEPILWAIIDEGKKNPFLVGEAFRAMAEAGRGCASSRYRRILDTLEDPHHQLDWTADRILNGLDDNRVRDGARAARDALLSPDVALPHESVQLVVIETPKLELPFETFPYYSIWELAVLMAKWPFRMRSLLNTYGNFRVKRFRGESKDEKWMGVALREGVWASAEHGLLYARVGVVVIMGNEVLGAGYNQPRNDLGQKSCFHAEYIAILRAMEEFIRRHVPADKRADLQKRLKRIEISSYQHREGEERQQFVLDSANELYYLVCAIEREIKEGNVRLIGRLSIYTMTEPCSRCGYLMRLLKVPKVVYGIAKPTGGSAESLKANGVKMVGGVLAEEVVLLNIGYVILGNKLPWLQSFLQGTALKWEKWFEMIRKSAKPSSRPRTRFPSVFGRKPRSVTENQLAVLEKAKLLTGKQLAETLRLIATRRLVLRGEEVGIIGRAGNIVGPVNIRIAQELKLPRDTALTFIKTPGGKYFMPRRAPHRDHPLALSAVTGSVRYKETPEDTVRREMEEELGFVPQGKITEIDREEEPGLDNLRRTFFVYEPTEEEWRMLQTLNQSLVAAGKALDRRTFEKKLRIGNQEARDFLEVTVDELTAHNNDVRSKTAMNRSNRESSVLLHPGLALTLTTRPKFLQALKEHAAIGTRGGSNESDSLTLPSITVNAFEGKRAWLWNLAARGVFGFGLATPIQEGLHRLLAKTLGRAHGITVSGWNLFTSVHIGRNHAPPNPSANESKNELFAFALITLLPPLANLVLGLVGIFYFDAFSFDLTHVFHWGNYDNFFFLSNGLLGALDLLVVPFLSQNLFDRSDLGRVMNAYAAREDQDYEDAVLEELRTADEHSLRHLENMFGPSSPYRRSQKALYRAIRDIGTKKRIRIEGSKEWVGFLPETHPETGDYTGRIVSYQKIHQDGILHAGVHLALMTKDGRVVAQRSTRGFLDVTAAGQLELGYSPEEGAITEGDEEVNLRGLGIKLTKDRLKKIALLPGQKFFRHSERIGDVDPPFYDDGGVFHLKGPFTANEQQDYFFVAVISDEELESIERNFKPTEEVESILVTTWGELAEWVDGNDQEIEIPPTSGIHQYAHRYVREDVNRAIKKILDDHPASSTTSDTPTSGGFWFPFHQFLRPLALVVAAIIGSASVNPSSHAASAAHAFEVTSETRGRDDQKNLTQEQEWVAAQIQATLGAEWLRLSQMNSDGVILAEAPVFPDRDILLPVADPSTDLNDLAVTAGVVRMAMRENRTLYVACDAHQKRAYEWRLAGLKNVFVVSAGKRAGRLFGKGRLLEAPMMDILANANNPEFRQSLQNYNLELLLSPDLAVDPLLKSRLRDWKLAVRSLGEFLPIGITNWKEQLRATLAAWVGA